MRSNRIRVLHRFACAALGLQLVWSAGVQLAHAQSPAAGAADAAPEAVGDSSAPQLQNDDLVEIVVTGSRLQRSDLASAAPISVIDEEAFAAQGVLQVSEAINEMPQLGVASGADSQNNNSLNKGFGFGSELINLRNLGAQRTLVLVNGRRHVGGDPGTSSVDLNAIPSAMIDRIEIVTGAASAIYGADAVSGVVNILLKDRFEGAQFTARYGQSGEDDGEERLFSALIGGSFGSDRGNALVSAEYASTLPINVVDRAFGFADLGGSPATFGTLAASNGSSAVPGGRFTASNLFFDESGVLRPFTPNDRYQRWPRKYLQNPVERKLVSSAIDFDLTSEGALTSNIYTEFSYSQSQTELKYEPTLALFSGGNYGTPNEAPFELPRIPADNPFLLNLPPETLARIGSIPANGLDFQRRFEEFGDRYSTIDRNTFRIATGLRGDIGERFRYDLYYQYGRVDATQDDQGTIDKNRVIAALDVDDGGTPGDLTDDVCADSRQRLLGCVPLNVFGPGTISQEFIDYATVPGVSKSVSTQDVVSGYVSGDLLSLWAGAIGVVLGGEYRSEAVEVEPAQTFVQGSNLTKSILGIRADYDVREAFAELSVPLLSGLRFARDLRLSGAVRQSDYSTVGSQTSWSARGEWSINSAAMVRATFGTAVRAPNLYELYAPRTAAIANVADPCDRISDAGTPLPALSAIRQQTCEAALGAAAATLDQTQVQRQTVGNISEGNPLLEAESAETFTLGLVLTPPGLLDGLSVTADYFEISIDEVISRLTIQNIVNECYDTAGLPAIFCDQVNRDPISGQLLSVNNAYLNAATESLDGLDFALDYAFDLNRLGGRVPGTLSLRAMWSHLFAHEFIQTASSPVDDRVGQVGDFDDRLAMRLAYAVGGFELSWDTRYLSAALADTSQDLGPRNHIDAFWYHDAQLHYRFADGRFVIRAGVKNIFDEQPPIITPPARTSPDGYATAAGVYDTRGRFFYFSATASL